MKTIVCDKRFLLKNVQFSIIKIGNIRHFWQISRNVFSKCRPVSVKPKVCVINWIHSCSSRDLRVCFVADLGWHLCALSQLSHIQWFLMSKVSQRHTLQLTELCRVRTCFLHETCIVSMSSVSLLYSLPILWGTFVSIMRFLMVMLKSERISLSLPTVNFTFSTSPQNLRHLCHCAVW